jgi:ABC-2 type transport system ATP-binding protein
MTDDLAITVDNLSKTFRLPHEKVTSLKSTFINFWRRDKAYERQKALSDINFDVKKGEFFGIIGRNGSGKSTMLKILAGIYSPSQGSVTVNGKLTPFIELGVGFNPELTGRENVFLNGALLGFNRKEMNAMYDDIVDFAGIERFMDQKLKNYSSGMQVRLAFSIAIKAETDILLIDEVLAVGDQSFQDKCLKYFEEVKKSNKTIVFISHDGSIIERFCDRVAIIDQGKLLGIGDARDMVFKYGAIMADEDYGQEKDNKQIHQGTGVLSLTSTQILDGNKKSVSAVEFGAPFSIKTQFKLNKKLKPPVIIGIDIISEDGVSVLGPNTKESMKEKIVLKSDGSFQAHFEKSPISPGIYSVTVAVFNEQATFAYELVENAVQFKIIGDARHGKIYIEPKWSIT